MNLHESLSHRAKQIVSAIAGAGVLVVLAVGFPPRSSGRLAPVDPGQTANVRVVNLTKSFSVVKASVTGENRVGAHLIRLLLRNDYDKTVTAYAAGRDGAYSARDLITIGGIRPGATVEFPDATPPPPEDTDLIVTVFAVVLEDGSGDGDPKIVQEFLDSRAAELAQEERAKRLLENVAGASDEKFSAEFEALKSRILELPVREAGRSFHYNAALNDARNLELYHLDQLQRIQRERGNEDCRARLKAAVERKTIKIAKLTPHKVER
jgi:hypothetical protein